MESLKNACKHFFLFSTTLFSLWAHFEESLGEIYLTSEIGYPNSKTTVSADNVSFSRTFTAFDIAEEYSSSGMGIEIDGNIRWTSDTGTRTGRLPPVFIEQFLQTPILYSDQTTLNSL